MDVMFIYPLISEPGPVSGEAKKNVRVSDGKDR